MHPKKSKIEIELNENHINSTNYDSHSFNDNEASSSNSNNGDAKSTAFNDEDKERKDNKGEAADRDVPDLIDRIEKDADSDSDSNNERDDEDKEEQEDNDRKTTERLQVTPRFLSNTNGIFGDSKDDQTPKKTRKTGRSLSPRVNGIFNNTDDPREINNNVINSNINPTHQQKRVKNYKGDSNSRSSYNNKDIKYQNNKREVRKRVKPTTDMPGLQDRNRPDSSSEDDNEYNRSEDEGTQQPKTMINTIDSCMISRVQTIQ